MSRKIIKRDDISSTVSDAAVAEPSDAAALPRAAPDLGGVVHRRVLEAQAQADALLAAARAEAVRIVDDAKALRARAMDDCAALRATATADGRDEGLATCTEFAARLLERKEVFFDTIGDDVLRLIQQTVEKITGQLTNESQQVLLAVVHQAVDAAIGEKITLRVHPQDAARLQQDEHALRAGLDRTSRLQVRADESVTPGGCIVETEVGTVDAQLPKQLSALCRGLGLPEPTGDAAMDESDDEALR